MYLPIADVVDRDLIGIEIDGPKALLVRASSHGSSRRETLID